MNSVGPYEAIALYKSVLCVCVCMFIYMRVYIGIYIYVLMCTTNTYVQYISYTKEYV